MPTFYSPNGNAEVWDTMPDGYMTESDYIASLTPPALTNMEKESNIEAVYHVVLQRLKDAYTSSTIKGDTASASAIQSEYALFLAAQKVDVDNIETPPTASPTLVLPSSLRCIDCGNVLAQVTLADTTVAMQCSTCGRIENALWFNTADSSATATGVDENTLSNIPMPSEYYL